MLTSPRTRSAPSVVLGDLAVVAVAAVWGSSYAVMQAVSATGLTVPNFLFARFLIAAVPLATFLLVRRRRIESVHVRYGLFYGVLLFAILYGETFGVGYTSASNAGFLITISVVLVPLYARVLGGTRQPRAIYGLSLLALAGCAALTLEGSGLSSLRLGDLIIIGAALIRAFQIYSFGRSSEQPKFDVASVTMVELAVVAALSLVVSPLVGPPPWEQLAGLSGTSWVSIIYLALLGSTFAFAAQLFAVRRTSAGRVALIMSTEPVFAAVFAVLLRGDHLGPLALLGGAAIVVAAALGRRLERSPTEPPGVPP